MQQENATQRFPVRIVVDDRERKSGVKEALRRRQGVNVAVRRLPLGDYQVDDTLLVERKTLSDFALSVRDCRLFSQVVRLTRQQTTRTCLILEGTQKRFPRLAIPKHAFQGALITVTLVFGLPVLRSTSPEETAKLILYAANQLQRRAVRLPRRRGFRFAGTRQRQILLLQAIPKIGSKRAQTLLNSFGTPAEIAAASVEQLEAAKGIGPMTARNIHRVFHGRPRDR